MISVPRAGAGHDDAILPSPGVAPNVVGHGPSALTPPPQAPYTTSLDRETGSLPTSRPVGGLPPPGPASMRVWRWSGRVVLLSLVLIVACAGIGAWLLLHPLLPWRR